MKKGIYIIDIDFVYKFMYWFYIAETTKFFITLKVIV